MPNIKGEESDSESGNPSGMAKQETSGERTAKQQESGGEEMTPDDMTQVWNALKKMKIRPENFLAWAASNSSTGLQPEPQSGTKQKSDSEAGYLKPQPRISIFSGDRKSDVSYDLWKYEVTCLMKESKSEETVLQTIRRSVRGEAANVIMRLGVSASIDEVLHKMDSIYGNVLEKEDVLAEFYSARQKDDESCSAWSCRLEETLNTAVKLGKVLPRNTNEMLKTMFYKGMRRELKDLCGYLYHSIHDFDLFRVEVRKIEMEHPAKTTADKPKQALAKGATVSKTDTSVDEKFEELQAQINQLQSQQQYYRPPFPGNRQRPAFQRGRRGHPSSRGQPGYTYRMPAHPIGPSAPRPTNPQWKQQSDPVICYKCGQEGHIALGCRVRLDHLNARWSNPRDKDLTKGTKVPFTKN